MGFFSSLFNTAQNPTQQEMELLAVYGDLAEELGAEQICRGLDEDLLPADKTHLREIIAKVSLNPLSGLVLNRDDLTKLYGLLEFFLPTDELEMVEAARAVAHEVEDEVAATKEQLKTLEAGMAVLQNANDEFQKAARDLRNHAASLGR